MLSPADPHDSASLKLEETALHWAASKNRLQDVKYLLKGGANVNARNEKLQTALHVAATVPDSVVVNCLLEFGAEINAEDCEKLTALHIATISQNANTVKLLLENGADVNKKCGKFNDGTTFQELKKSFKTPLHIAAQLTNNEIFNMLLEHGADIESKDQEGKTPLHFASVHGNVEFVKTLLEKGASVNVISDVCLNEAGGSALHFAVQLERLEVVKMLCKAGANVNAKNIAGFTPLHILAANNDHDVREIPTVLLEFGAYIDSRDSEGKTPLHLAFAQGYFYCIQTILRNGADINLLSDTLLSTFDYAMVEKTLFLSPFGDDDTWALPSESDRLKYLQVPIHNSLDAYGIETFDCYVSTRKLADMYIHKALLNEDRNLDEVDYYEYEFDEDQFNKNCQRELSEMKLTNIGDSKVTYYRFLRKSVQGLVNFLKSEHVKIILSSNYHERNFPSFRILIDCHFQMGLLRQKLIEKLRPNYNVIFNWLPEECIEIVLKYLSNDEVYNIVSCLSTST